MSPDRGAPGRSYVSFLGHERGVTVPKCCLLHESAFASMCVRVYERERERFLYPLDLQQLSKGQHLVLTAPQSTDFDRRTQGQGRVTALGQGCVCGAAGGC